MCRLKENFLPLIPIGSRRNPRDPRVRVAILDTGINKEGLTTDQQERIIAMRDWTSEGSDMVDTTGHGTFIASLILNMAEACHLYVGKVFNSSDSNDETPEHVAEVGARFPW
jgi:subtilisin family serine protease